MARTVMNGAGHRRLWIFPGGMPTRREPASNVIEIELMQYRRSVGVP